tara:strand:+ start:3001 stop:4980 length:1980 start_codon:yes stop_codon:yes gene_type:complete
MAFENNVQATLQANVAIGATTLDVVKAVAPNKDVPVSGRLTLSGTNKTEIITYTGRTDNTTYWTITGVTKDAESSFGDQAWSAGDACYQALTAADVTALSNRQTATRLDFVATAGQATKTDLTYTVGNIDCYLNGSKLTLGTDFTATDGVSVTFAPALTLNDEVQLIMDAGASGSASGESSVGGQSDFVASGTLPNGTPVILNADGTVSSVLIESTTSTEAIPAGSAYTFATTNNDIVAAYDPNTAGRFLVVCKDEANGSSGKAIVGNVTGTSISFGPEVTLNAGSTSYLAMSFDPNTADKFVVTYMDWSNSGVGTAVVGSISGTNVITFGAKTVFNAGANLTYRNSIAFYPNTANKFILVHQGGKAHIGTVTGTSVSFSPEVTFTAGTAGYSRIVADPYTSGRFVLTYSDSTLSNYGVAVLVNTTGSTLSFSGKYVFNSSTTAFLSLAFDPHTANKFLVLHRDGLAHIGTLTGTGISFNTPSVFNAGDAYYVSMALDPITPNRFVVSYTDSSNTYGTAIVGTISGNTTTFGSEYVFNALNTRSPSVAFDPNTSGNFVVAYHDKDGSNYGEVIVGQLPVTEAVTNLTADNFIGIPTEAYADTTTATVTLPAGLSTNQSGLVAGSEYYIQNDGTLSTTAGNPSVLIGKALSATSILLKAY